MQQELDAGGVVVRILGVNDFGHESANGEMCNGRDLPWLQDVNDGAHVWTSWNVAYRDVVILDRENRKLEAFNLTTHNLGNAADYTLLKEKLRGYATP